MISLNIASHKAREQALKQMLPYALSQGTKPDAVNIYLNDFKTVPKWLKDLQKYHDELNVVTGKEAFGDLGASAKFAFLDAQDTGIYITLDDDLIADPRYVGYLADMVARYGNAFVGLHGTKYTWHPAKSFYNGPGRVIDYCYGGKAKTESVDMLGTGVLAFPVNIGLQLDWFHEKNMTDPQLCKWAKTNGVPMVCLVREAGIVKEIKSAQDSAIWKGVEKDDSVQTAIINSIENFERLPMPAEFPVNKTGDAAMEWQHLKLIANNLREDELLLEFGSGLSTDYWRKRKLQYMSIEHDKRYTKEGDKRSLYAPIDPETGWYTRTGELNAAIVKGDVVVIDGPIGSTGERYNLPINALVDKRLIWVDDVHRPKDLAQAEAIAEVHEMKLTIIKGQQKSIAKLERQ